MKELTKSQQTRLEAHGFRPHVNMLGYNCHELNDLKRHKFLTVGKVKNDKKFLYYVVYTVGYATLINIRFDHFEAAFSFVKVIKHYHWFDRGTK